MKRHVLILSALIMAIVWLLAGASLAAEVSEDTARQVAEHFVQQYVASHGEWAGSGNPSITGIEQVTREKAPIAYNFTVSPSGHLLVPCHDEFSPVLLYSTTSEFVPGRVNEPGSVESWIIPEISSAYRKISNKTAAARTGSPAGKKVARAWRRWRQISPTQVSAERPEDADDRDSPAPTAPGSQVVNPLLNVSWDQPAPYNLFAPNYNCSQTSNGHVLTGCVATAMAQLMSYWNWPDAGTGSHSYKNNGFTMSADFAHAYNWPDMPGSLTDSSAYTEKDAVARLISDAGIAVNMSYGCVESGALAAAIAPALTTYFKYSDSIKQFNREDYNDGSWFNLFTAELDAVPPRPVLFSIKTTDQTYEHEVVVDGYQTGSTNMVHVNLGWGGSYSGWYDITHNFTTGSDTWSATTQSMLTNIRPGNGYVLPDFTVAISSTSLSAAQGASVTADIDTALTGHPGSAVNLTVVDLPKGVMAGLSPSSIAAPGSGRATLTLTASSSTPPGLYKITVTAAGLGKQHAETIALTVTSAAAALAPVNGICGADNSPCSSQTQQAAVSVPDGILFPMTGKSRPDLSDALAVLKLAVGINTPTAADLTHADVAPLGNDGRPRGDGKIDVSDVIGVLRMTVGTL
jgi:hypothetical protein